MIKQLKFVGIPTRDQDRALPFWTEKIGFTVLTDRSFGEQRWIELSIPGAQTGISLYTPEGHEDRVGSFFNGSFECNDVTYSYRLLSERGCSLRVHRKSSRGELLQSFSIPMGTASSSQAASDPATVL